MKVLVEGAELARAAQHVSRVLDKLDPDHTHITLTAEHDTVTLTANSRSQWARTRLDADVLEPGTVIVSGFWFTALAGQNGLGETVIETRTDARGEWLHTVNGRTRARMRLMPGAAENEWPDMQGMELALPDGTLPRLINAVTHCASRNQSRPLLTGVQSTATATMWCSRRRTGTGRPAPKWTPPASPAAWLSRPNGSNASDGTPPACTSAPISSWPPTVWTRT